MKLKTKIDLTFIITTLIVVILLYVTFQNVNFVNESSDLMNKSHKFLYDLEKIESSVVKIETSSRGFIISGNEIFLDKLEEAKTEAFNSINVLQQKHHGHYHATNFSHLVKLIQEKTILSEKNINLRKIEGMSVAMDSVSFGNGRKLMDEIARIVKQIEKEEFELLSSTMNENRAYAVSQNNTFKVLSSFIFLIILIFHFFIRRHTFQIFYYKEKQAELIKELNHQNKQLDDFVHMVTHNVRSPANNITSLVSMINDESDPAKIQFLFAKLSLVSDNLNETLNELLEIIQIKQNGGIQHEYLNFNTMFSKIINSLQADIILKGASVSCNFEECPDIKYPKTYLESIGHNLLSNSLKYSCLNRKPEIRISTGLVEGKPVLKVSDNGLGMDLKRIGDKIFGLRKTFHSAVDSKGIGLFMTKTHIESLGGRITVESEVDKGTTFTVYFDKNVKENYEIDPIERIQDRSKARKFTDKLYHRAALWFLFKKFGLNKSDEKTRSLMNLATGKEKDAS